MTLELKERTIEHIVDIEWGMFSTVKACEPTECQQQAGAFRVMRWMSHSVLPEQVLESIQFDLEQAEKQNRNLMTEKYARMENLIPPRNDNKKINEIVAAESDWMISLAERYPYTFQGSLLAFGLYEACELETYSDRTIELYHEFVIQARKEGKNLVEERYTNLFRQMGYASLSAREAESVKNICSQD